MSNTEYRLLTQFRLLFEGSKYRHRASTQGDIIAMQFYEDLLALGKSPKLVERVRTGERVLNAQNVRRGIKARRGDGTFGEIIPGRAPVADPGYTVTRGPIATVEIGIEVKVLAKAMIKQIDRVMNDLRGQVTHFRRGGGNPICIGIVGINHADRYVSYEGKRSFKTTGRGGFPHPIQEADHAATRLAEAGSAFDEFLVLQFRATNERPYPFEWVDIEATKSDYGAVLVRVSRKYEERF